MDVQMKLISNIRRFYNHKTEAEFARCILSAEQAQYQKMAEMYEIISILRHDFKYYLKKIEDLLETGDIDKTKQHLAEIKKKLPESGLHYYCTDHAINALLTSYAQNCKEFNIEYNVEITLPKTLSMHRYDICIVLCNLLENALEACKKSENKKEINLAIKTNAERIAIRVKNSFNSAVKKNVNLKSVKAIAKRYGGHVSMEQTESVLTVYVMMNIC